MAKLERVFGTTACSGSLSVDPLSGLVAYPAGSIVVVLNPRTLSQAHLVCASKNQLTSLAFSPNGRYIVTGEFGAEPKVRVWELRHEEHTRGEQRVELAYHRLGISCVCFTKDSDQVISVGNQHDKSVCVWDWRTRTKLAESRLTCQVNAMDVSDSGRMFVTVGVRHVKFWYLECNDNDGGGVLLLHGRSAILADQRNNTFADVCCALNNRTFSITISKLLLEFVDKKLVNIYELGGEVPFSLSFGAPHKLFMGFGNGAIRAMNLEQMKPELELCRPHTLHCDVGATNDGTEAEDSQQQKYPDVHSIVFHSPSNVLTALYSDRSIYHWNVQQPSSKIHSFKISSQLFHVGPVFDIEVSNSQPQLFFTAGADETVRVWYLNNSNTASATNATASTTDRTLPPSINSTSPSPILDIGPPNHFSLELRKILYLSAGTDSLSEQPDKNFGGILSDTLDSTTGVRCIKLSSVGAHLGCGTRSGNICVFDLNDREMPKLVELEVHEGEVLCLEYCVPSSATNGLHLLASGSRDRLIHVFNVDQQYTHLLTIDDHSSSISALRFNFSQSNLFQLVTFGTDKLVVVRELMLTNAKSSSAANSSSSQPSSIQLSTRRLSQIVSNNGPNCMTVTRDGNVLVGCQDRQLRMYSEAGKLLKTVKGTVCEEGTITKFCLDHSESFAATICSDRFVYIMDLSNGECVAVLNGQSDSVTGISFSSDCKRLLLVSYSGCVLVWRLSLNLTRRMRAKLAQLRHEMGDRSTTPDSLGSEDSAQQRHQPDDFGSLTSLNICQQKTLSVTTSPTEVTLRQEDDELDSGIGGGRSSGGRRAELGAHRQQQKSTFELKRVLPSDAIIRRRLSGGEAQEPLTGLPPIASPPPAPSSVSNMQLYPQNVVTAAAVTPNRSSHHPQGAAPPPYHAAHHFHQHGGAATVGANSRSMSNLNYIRQTPHQQQQHQQLHQQRNAVSTGRRRWNNNVSSSFITASAGAGCVTQQQGQQRCHPQGGGTTFGTQKPSNPISNANHHPPSFHSQQFSSPVYNNNSSSPHLQPGNYQYQQQLPHQQHYFQTPQQQQNQLGGLSMSTSVSLNALRTMLADDGGSGAVGEIGGQQQSLTLAPQSAFDAPSPLPTSSMENSPLDNGWVRNSVSRRYLQNGRSHNKTPSSTTYFLPVSVTGVTKLFQQRVRAVREPHRRANCLTGLPRQTGSSSPEPPAHKGRMAMNKLKQRRLSTAREDPSLDGVNPFRSRSQSPTHLAIQSLSALATSSQPPPVKPPSPRYGMSRISSSPSSTSRSQQRRLSSVNATRLQEARERLKKSQENLAALGAHGGQSDVADEETTMTSGIFGMSGRARSKSIGNLMRISVRNGVTAATLSEQQRQMAKSVTDLGSDVEQLGHDIEQQQHANAIDMTMSTVGGSRLAQLSASRQRLAQSIRDMRLISNSDLTEPSQYNPQSQEVQQQTSPDSANSSCGSSALLQSQQTSGYYSPPKGMTAMRRGVQKKIDRTSTSKLLRTDNPTFSRRTTAGNSGKQQEMRLRSVSSVAATQRINYMAQKLARSGPNSARSPSSSHGVHYQNHSTEQHQLDTARSLSIELASATHSLSNAAQMTSTGSTKKMAMHASECIQEMTHACDKLLGTRQLINSDPDISSDERRLLLSGVNRAISAFRQRLDSVLVHPGGGGDDGTGTGDEASVMTHVGKWDGEENGLRV
uniref:Mitogen-activated protein kinase-binding protein 1 n=1 Tax=Globodera rostochiensis TaxID=31243 RepID=A0A914GS67_GLORO